MDKFIKKKSLGDVCVLGLILILTWILPACGSFGGGGLLGIILPGKKLVTEIPPPMPGISTFVLEIKGPGV